MQHDREALAREPFVEVDEVKRASARAGELIPVAVHIDELIAEVDVGILIRRRKEDVVDKERYRLRDLPREVDRLCALRDRGQRGIVIGLPVKTVGVESDDVLIVGVALCDGVFRLEIRIRRGRERLPRESCQCRNEDDTEQCDKIFPYFLKKSCHLCVRAPLRNH